MKAGGFASGLDGMEPNSNMAHHMQLVNSIINDGSLHNLVFSNGSLNTELLQQTKSQVAKLISGSPVKTRSGNEEVSEAFGLDGLNNQFDEDDDDDDDQGDQDDCDEQIIVTMLRSMNSKKLETH